MLQLALALGLTLTHGLLLGRLKPYVHQHDNRLGDLLNILTVNVRSIASFSTWFLTRVLLFLLWRLYL